jgi:hypothetical protein
VINKPTPSRIPAPDAEIHASSHPPVVLPEHSLPEKEVEGKGSGKENAQARDLSTVSPYDRKTIYDPGART